MADHSLEELTQMETLLITLRACQRAGDIELAQGTEAHERGEQLARSIHLGAAEACSSIARELGDSLRLHFGFDISDAPTDANG